MAGEDPDARRAAGLSKALQRSWQKHGPLRLTTHTCIGSRPRLSYKLAAVRRTLRTNEVLPGKRAQRQRKQENRVPGGTRKHRSTCPANGVAFLQRQAAPEAEERQRKAAESERKTAETSSSCPEGLTRWQTVLQKRRCWKQADCPDDVGIAQIADVLVLRALLDGANLQTKWMKKDVGKSLCSAALFSQASVLKSGPHARVVARSKGP